jgi:hypothetical protein
MTTAVKERTLATVQEEYGQKWGDVLQAIYNERQNGKPCLDSLIRRGVEVQRQAGRVDTDFDTLYKSYRDIARRIGRGAHQYKAEAIIELGAGWGVNLANVWADARVYEHRRLVDIPYWGFEPVSAGRQCMEELANHTRGFDIRPRHYDFNEAEYWLDAAQVFPYKRVLVVTCHAIEQVPQIREDVFTSLLDRFEHVRGMHFEPVEWQWRVNSTSSHASLYAAENDYNGNLQATLLSLFHAYKISYFCCDGDVSMVNPVNPTALVEWEKV